MSKLPYPNLKVDFVVSRNVKIENITSLKVTPKAKRFSARHLLYRPYQEYQRFPIACITPGGWPNLTSSSFQPVSAIAKSH